jgi:hypothetical protein
VGLTASGSNLTKIKQIYELETNDEQCQGIGLYIYENQGKVRKIEASDLDIKQSKLQWII